MPKLTYFPLMMDRWIGGTRELTYEQKGFYIDLLIWMYQTGNGIKNAEHAARVLGCDPRISRRLLADLRGKFYERSGELFHKLVREIIKNGGKVKGLGFYENLSNLPIDPDPDPENIYINKLESTIAKTMPKTQLPARKTDWQKRQDWEADIQAQAADKGLSSRPGESWQAFAARVRTTRRAGQ